MTSNTHAATGCKLLFLIHCLEKMSQLHAEEEGWRITTVIHLYYLPVETSYLVTIPLSLCFLQQLHKLHNLIPMRALHLSCYRTVISLAILKQNPLQCYCSMFYYTLHSTEMSVNKTTKAYANQKYECEFVCLANYKLFHSTTGNKSQKRHRLCSSLVINTRIEYWPSNLSVFPLLFSKYIFE